MVCTSNHLTTEMPHLSTCLSRIVIHRLMIVGLVYCVIVPYKGNGPAQGGERSQSSTKLHIQSQRGFRLHLNIPKNVLPFPFHNHFSLTLMENIILLGHSTQLGSFFIKKGFFETTFSSLLHTISAGWIWCRVGTCILGLNCSLCAHTAPSLPT